MSRGAVACCALTRSTSAHVRVVASYVRRCVECGLPLGKKDFFCPRCGAKQPREPRC